MAWPTCTPHAPALRATSSPPLTTAYTEAAADADTLLTAAATTGPDGTHDGLRAGFEPAVLATLRWTGLRAGELCTLPLAGLDLDRQLLTVVGKGTKQRTIPLPDVLTHHLDHYLREVRPALPTSPLLFTNPKGQQAGQPLTGRAPLDLSRRLGATTGIDGPHTALRWRHTYASLSLARGIDLYVLSRQREHLNTGALADSIRRAYPRPGGQRRP